MRLWTRGGASRIHPGTTSPASDCLKRGLRRLNRHSAGRTRPIRRRCFSITKRRAKGSTISPTPSTRWSRILSIAARPSTEWVCSCTFHSLIWRPQPLPPISRARVRWESRFTPQNSTYSCLWTPMAWPGNEDLLRQASVYRGVGIHRQVLVDRIPLSRHPGRSTSI